jgi:hypothetical protein
MIPERAVKPIVIAGDDSWRYNLKICDHQQGCEFKDGF